MAFLLEDQNDLANSSGYYKNKNKIKYRLILILFVSSIWMNVYQGNPYFLLFGNQFKAIHRLGVVIHGAKRQWDPFGPLSGLGKTLWIGGHLFIANHFSEMRGSVVPNCSCRNLFV